MPAQLLEEKVYEVRELKERDRNISYNPLELYTFSATYFYTIGSGPLGGGLFRSKPLGSGLFRSKPLGFAKSRPIEIRPIRSTETFSLKLDYVYPGLRLVDKFHPPKLGYLDIDYKEVFGLKSAKMNTDLIDNLLFKKKIK